jgi:hypothetical protein
MISFITSNNNITFPFFYIFTLYMMTRINRPSHSGGFPKFFKVHNDDEGMNGFIYNIFKDEILFQISETN